MTREVAARNRATLDHQLTAIRTFEMPRNPLKWGRAIRRVLEIIRQVVRVVTVLIDELDRPQ